MQLDGKLDILNAKERAQRRWHEKQRAQGLKTITVRVPESAAEFVKAIAERLRDGVPLGEAAYSTGVRSRSPQGGGAHGAVREPKGRPLQRPAWEPEEPRLRPTGRRDAW